MRKLSVICACLLLGGQGWLDARAQDTAGAIFFPHRQFKIPFKNDQKALGVTQVRLYVSNDQGRSWQFTATAAPDEQAFRFSTPQDGYYWFAVQTVDGQGKLHPPATEDLKPSLRVIVDSTPPSVQVQTLPPRGGEIGVKWEVRDENLDLSLPDALRVEYRFAGASAWIPLAIPPGASQIYWNPHANTPIEVRVLARDRAGNVGEEKITIRPGGGAGVPFQNPVPQADPFRDLERKFVNSKQISLSYDLRDVGPSGVSAIELWYTLYQGRAWNKLTEYPIDLKNAGEANQTKKLTFEVNDEGVYGITLVAKSGVGLGERAPQPGDRPQFWIEVDLTRPIVQIQDITVGAGLDKGKLTIGWSARDKNLGPAPIRLSYAEQPTGPWQPIADKLANNLGNNNGRYTWKMPEMLPYQFYVKVEATDLAGNIGEAVTLERVKVDLSLPKAHIRDVSPGGQ